MALTLSEIQAVSTDSWLPGSYQNWMKGNVLMHKLLEKKELIGPAEKVRVVLEHAIARGGAMGAATIFNTARKDVINAAKFPWAYFYAGTTIDIADETQVSGGDAEVNLVLAKLDNAQRSVKSYQGDSLWALYATSQATYGGETKPFYGIADLVNQSNTSPAFGEINKADLGNSEQKTNIWLAYSSSTARLMNFETMQFLRRGCAISNDADGMPNLYISTVALRDNFENSLQAQQRFEDKDMASAGFESVLFGKAPVTADDRCTSGDVYGFNTSRLYLKVHRDFDYRGPVWLQPTNQYIKTTQIIWSGAFVTSERRAHGVLTSVT